MAGGGGGSDCVTGETQVSVWGQQSSQYPKVLPWEGAQACEEPALRHRDPTAMDLRGTEQKAISLSTLLPAWFLHRL